MSRKLTGITLAALFAASIIAIPAFAEENISVAKTSPQYDEIIAKMQAKADAAQQKRIADLALSKQTRANQQLGQDARENRISVADRILFQYQKFDLAETIKEMEHQITLEHAKKQNALEKHIWFEVKNGNVGFHESKTIEYGRTQ